MKPGAEPFGMASSHAAAGLWVRGVTPSLRPFGGPSVSGTTAETKAFSTSGSIFQVKNKESSNLLPDSYVVLVVQFSHL